VGSRLFSLRPHREWSALSSELYSAKLAQPIRAMEMGHVLVSDLSIKNSFSESGSTSGMTGSRPMWSESLKRDGLHMVDIVMENRDLFWMNWMRYASRSLGCSVRKVSMY